MATVPEAPLSWSFSSWASRQPFRRKMVALTAAAVIATLVLVLTPIYFAGRERLTALNAMRLSAIARSAAVAIPSDSIDVIARPDGRSGAAFVFRSEEHTSELQSQSNLVCRLLL